MTTKLASIKMYGMRFTIVDSTLEISTDKHPKRVESLIQHHLPVKRLIRSLFAHHIGKQYVEGYKAELLALRKGVEGYHWGQKYYIPLKLKF